MDARRGDARAFDAVGEDADADEDGDAAVGDAPARARVGRRLGHR